MVRDVLQQSVAPPDDADGEKDGEQEDSDIDVAGGHVAGEQPLEAFDLTMLKEEIGPE